MARRTRDSSNLLQVSEKGVVDTQGPRKFQIKTVAKASEALNRAEIIISQEGPVVKFALESNTKVLRWQDDPDLQEALAGIMIRGLSGMAF